MVKRRFIKRTKGKKTRQLTAEMQYISVVSPSSTVSLGWSRLPATIRDSTFKLITFTVHASARDSATANTYQDGPAFIQLRQIAPDGKTTLRTSRAYLVSNHTKIRFPCDKVEYIGPWRGDTLIAIDCLCPKSGYEVGAGLTILARFRYDHVPLGEACPTLECHPTLGLLNTSVSEDVGSFTMLDLVDEFTHLNTNKLDYKRKHRRKRTKSV